MMTLCFFISPYFFLQKRRKMGVFGWFLPQKWSWFFTFVKALFCYFSAKIFTAEKLLQKVCQTTLRSKPFKKWAKNPRFVQYPFNNCAVIFNKSVTGQSLHLWLGSHSTYDWAVIGALNGQSQIAWNEGQKFAKTPIKKGFQSLFYFTENSWKSGPKNSLFSHHHYIC